MKEPYEITCILCGLPMTDITCPCGAGSPSAPTAPKQDVIAEAEKRFKYARDHHDSYYWPDGVDDIFDALHAHARQLEKDKDELASLYAAKLMEPIRNIDDAVQKHMNELREEVFTATQRIAELEKERDEAEKTIRLIQRTGIIIPELDDEENLLTRVNKLTDERDSLQVRLDGAVKGELFDDAINNEKLHILVEGSDKEDRDKITVLYQARKLNVLILPAEVKKEGE